MGYCRNVDGHCTTFSTLVIVRHGETVWNVEERWQGHADSSLTEKGKMQTQQLAIKLRNILFAAVYSSDLLRSSDTAKLLSVTRNLEVQLTQALRERYAGRIQGTTAQERQRSEELRELIVKYFALTPDQRWHGRPFPEWETDEEVVSRVLTQLRVIAVAHPQQSVLVVTHGGVMRNLLVHLGHISREAASTVKMDNAGYMILTSDGVEFWIKKVQGLNGANPWK